MSDDVRTALSALDVNDDNDWTSDGAPSLLALSELLGREVTRKDIAACAKGFSRNNPVVVKPVAKKAKPANAKAKVDDEKSLAKQVADAQLVANKANAELKRLVEKLDVLVTAREREAKRIGPARAIKAYQKSQAEQRAAAAKAGKLQP
jgi:hypothetical protein